MKRNNEKLLQELSNRDFSSNKEIFVGLGFDIRRGYLENEELINGFLEVDPGILYSFCICGLPIRHIFYQIRHILFL